MDFRRLTANETNIVLKTLHEVRATVLFKFLDSGVHRTKAEGKAWGHSVLGARPVTLGESRRDQMVTANFGLDGEMYFFQAKVRLQKKLIHLEIIESISRLVRRRNPRLKVPGTVPLHLVTKRVGDRLLFIRGPVQDISLRGFRAAFYNEAGSVKAGDIVSGTLRFGNRKGIDFTAVARHSKKPGKGRFNQTVGLEFLKMDDVARFQNWLVDLHREHYAQHVRK